MSNYKDYFNKQLIEGNTVVIVRDAGTVQSTNVFIVRISKLFNNDVLAYKQYSYDGINWNDIKEVHIKTNRVFKYILWKS